ncbi:outer membrane protein TolC [Dysgonomonas alginatilytica]|uniref:Outer membrane protein TolC n=2 Tax=Dysgonomonas alginatilytica TaxID=1605892 RepID=A0A2V3PQ82_9BACT|nr:TolC family protein [Dysgonomonas alginatilytica]PXV58955.1 outer membrane protein TolC [Dysgonomonas alginatilytica]
MFIILLLFCTNFVQGQQNNQISLTINKAIDIARKQSPQITVARHSFRSSYWNYCYFKANYLPSLAFSSTPNFNHSINVINMPDGTSQFIQQNELSTDGMLSISQNIALTGGTLSLKSSIQRLDILGENKNYSYLTNPITISYQQSLFGYNKLKWDKKIEPLRFEEAKKEYVELIELVSTETVRKFFDLTRAQTNLQIAQTNYANTDTLYSFAQRRYNIGTITENDMLQLEVNRLNEESNMLNAQIEVDNYTQELRSYLGITEDIEIEVVLEENTPQFIVDLHKALYLATNNSPDIIKMERKKQESESNVANARASAGLKADIFAQLGLTQTGENIRTAYRDPLNQQYVEIGIRLPILDWGRGKGQIQVAKSNRDMVYTQIKQDKINFELNVTRIVKQFNLQNNRINVALKTDATANRRNEVARKLYILGRSTILDLNTAISEKDTAKRNYINALYNYWSLYYVLRSLTLYDFEKDVTLTEDYELLLK